MTLPILHLATRNHPPSPVHNGIISARRYLKFYRTTPQFLKQTCYNLFPSERRSGTVSELKSKDIYVN